MIAAHGILSTMTAKVNILRDSHKNSESELRICWKDASKFSTISSVSLLFVVFQDLTGPGRATPSIPRSGTIVPP
jgi:hypothetical protein